MLCISVFVPLGCHFLFTCSSCPLDHDLWRMEIYSESSLYSQGREHWGVGRGLDRGGSEGEDKWRDQAGLRRGFAKYRRGSREG